jgi:hypothetical protein
MKPKNPADRGARKGSAALDRSTSDPGRAVVIDFIQGRIEAFNQAAFAFARIEEATP